MSLFVPGALRPSIETADKTPGALIAMDVAQSLLNALRNGEPLSPDEPEARLPRSKHLEFSLLS